MHGSRRHLLRIPAHEPDSENVNSTKEIESYIDARFSWLDKYLADLAEQ